MAHGTQLAIKYSTLMGFDSPACLPLMYSLEVMVDLAYKKEET